MASPKLLKSLSESDLRLVHASAAEELRALDEDELLELHARVRRARNKHVGIYRRAGAEKVSAKAARGKAHGANDRNRARAEVLEQTLARVSKQLSVAARQSARELKEERLAAARGEAPASGSTGRKTPAKPKSTPAPKKAAVAKKKAAKTPDRKKREAGTRATGARRQAKRDGRAG